jgi:hypothetical protein
MNARKKSPMAEALSRPIMLHICRDATNRHPKEQKLIKNAFEFILKLARLSDAP